MVEGSSLWGLVLVVFAWGCVHIRPWKFLGLNVVYELKKEFLINFSHLKKLYRWRKEQISQRYKKFFSINIFLNLGYKAYTVSLFNYVALRDSEANGVYTTQLFLTYPLLSSFSYEVGQSGRFPAQVKHKRLSDWLRSRYFHFPNIFPHCNSHLSPTRPYRTYPLEKTFHGLHNFFFKKSINKIQEVAHRN